MRDSADAPDRKQLSHRPILSSSLRLPPECCSARPSRPTEAGRLLSWTSLPFSTPRSRGPLSTGFACPLRSAFRVWLPSWRLAPSGPAPVFFRTGGAHGIRPSELSPPERYSQRFRSEQPAYRFSCQYSRRKRLGRPGRPRFPGFDPSGRPSRAAVWLARRPPVAPVGFALPGLIGERLGRDFAQPPLTRFQRTAVTGDALGAPESRSTLAQPRPRHGKP